MLSIRNFGRGAGIVLLLSAAGFGGWLLSLPAPAPYKAAPAHTAEARAMLNALKPPKRHRPLIALVSINDATEATDFLLPTSILRRADVAEVVTLSTGSGPVTLYPALTVEADATIAQFEARNPDGADYVIVPAMSRDDDPAIVRFLQSQADKGAIIIGVCAGAKVVGASGLLEGKRATTHWYFIKELFERTPSATYVPDRRIVVDGGVVTTTGISASMPMMLTLVEAIAGPDKAKAVAREISLAAWDARHDSSAFKFTRPFATTVMGNVLAFWNREQIALQLRPTVDEASLALVADAWSRTYRSKAFTFTSSRQPIESRNGVRIIPDVVTARPPTEAYRPTYLDETPAVALDETLQTIGSRYGRGTAEIVAMQLEYPGWLAR